jgi:transcriptional regulator with GAF, ATPase, and Fis domain
MSRPEDETTLVVATRTSIKLPSHSFSISVVQGEDVGISFLMDRADPTRVLVGTSPACGLRLTDRQVSRRHLALESTGQFLRVTDLGSTNGSYVNGIRVESALLAGGEKVVLGGTTLQMQAFDGPAAPMQVGESRFGRLLGASEAMRRLYPLCERLAKSGVPILIEGETGTGKELLAESLHEQSARADRPFVVFDCSTVAPSLIESRLFGHERGAFTGATSARKGVFELAHGGTIFIDEIGELGIDLQPRLLRAIERGEIARVGSERWLRVDVRVIAATRRDLDRAVQNGEFRDDLFYRLAVGRIELPPLRRRKGDVSLLGTHFWKALGDPEEPVPQALLARFEQHDWPGNVRELLNAVARHRALGDLAAFRDGPAESPASSASREDNVVEFVQRLLEEDLPLSTAKQELIRRFEPLYLARVLARHEGDAGKASAASGIARRYFNVLRARYRT